MKRRNRKKKEAGLRERISQRLALPEDMLLDLPRITLCGNRTIEVENYKNVLEYLEHTILLNCTNSIVKFEGNALEITAITDDSISIRGQLNTLSFTK